MMEYRSGKNPGPYTWRSPTTSDTSRDTPSISCVIPLGSADLLPRLRDLIRSIREQQGVADWAPEIILSYILRSRSDLTDLQKIVDSIKDAGVVLVVHEQDYEHFPLALARNVGALHASGAYLCFIDVDILLDSEAFARTIYAPDVVSAILTSYLPETVMYSSGDMLRRLARSGTVSTTGYGGYMVVRREDFYDIGGYDEVYDLAWGCEDNDMIDRLVAHGMRLENISNSTGIVNVHQPHERRYPENRDDVARNRERYWHEQSIVRNGGPRGAGCDVTAFVITSGEPSTAECLSAVFSQEGINYRVVVVCGVRPMPNAFQKMLDNCRTPYFVQVDADMILKPNAVAHLHRFLLQTEARVAIACTTLTDTHLGRPIVGVKIYKHGIVSRFPYTEAAFCEMGQVALLKEAGFDVSVNWVDAGYGEHRSCQTLKDSFERYRDLFLRWSRGDMGWIEGGLQKIVNRLGVDVSSPDFWALLGALAGAGESYPRAGVERGTAEGARLYDKLAKVLKNS